MNNTISTVNILKASVESNVKDLFIVVHLQFMEIKQIFR